MWLTGTLTINANFNLNLNVNLNFNVNVNLNANWPDGMWLMVWDYEGKELEYS